MRASHGLLQCLPIAFVVLCLTLAIVGSWMFAAAQSGQTNVAASSTQGPNYSIPTLDLSKDRFRQGIVDREPGQYLGHPTTCKSSMSLRKHPAI